MTLAGRLRAQQAFSDLGSLGSFNVTLMIVL